MWEAYSVNKKININNMFSMFRRHYDKDYSFSGETHNFWECLLVLEGEVCVSSDERVYNLKKDEIIFHKPLEMHKFHIENPNGSDVFIFSFSAEGEFMSYFKNKVFLLSSEQKNIVHEMISYAEKQIRNFNISIDRFDTNMYITPFEIIPTYSQVISLYICHFLLSLGENENTAMVSDSTDAIIFRNAVNYMNNHITEQPPVIDIAKYCLTSQTSLKRIFDKYAGISIHKYFIRLKFKVATELLSAEMSVTDVSEKLGFANQGYFSVAFKRETGVSPTEFKKQI